jgi:CheY-like chemotaxis protein
VYVSGAVIAPREERPAVARLTAADGDSAHIPAKRQVAMAPENIEDDRENIQAGDATVLIVEDDPAFTHILLDMAHQRRLKGVVAARGDVALALAKKMKPSAVTLDIGLPDMAGWAVLDRLRHDPETRHIPVHVISIDENRRLGTALGASSQLRKVDGRDRLEDAFDRIRSSLDRKVRNVLVVEPDLGKRDEILQVIGSAGVRTATAGSATEALGQARSGEFDCVICPAQLPDTTVSELLYGLQATANGRELRVILRDGAGAPGDDEEGDWPHLTVRRVDTMERLLDETSLALHRSDEELSEEKKRMLQEARQKDPILAGHTVLIVDDDVRNIFALTSILERHQLSVVHAENGREGIEMLRSMPDIDIVLMDVMMPGMDGYQTMQEIRKHEEFRSLPIIALTAKAMKGDREKCIEAGASDYIPKPVDLEQLFALLRVWLLQSSYRPMTQAAAERV